MKKSAANSSRTVVSYWLSMYTYTGGLPRECKPALVWAHTLEFHHFYLFWVLLFISALHKAGKHMENSIVAAYVALLVGCLIQENQVSLFLRWTMWNGYLLHRQTPNASYVRLHSSSQANTFAVHLQKYIELGESRKSLKNIRIVVGCVKKH